MRLISDRHSGVRFLIVILVLPLLAFRLFAGPVVSLSSQTLDLGEIPAGVETVRSVTVSNAGDAPLTVLKVSACCGASASVSSPRLAPGESVELTVTLRPLVPSGAFSKSVRLYTDDPDHPVAEVSVIGNARAAAVTPAASFSSVGSRALPASPVPVTAVGAPPLSAPAEANQERASFGGRALSGVTLGAIVLAGIADGFNPCAFSIVIVLAGILAVGGRRRRARMLGGWAFCTGSFLTYMAMGLGLMQAVAFLDRLRTVHDIVLGALALSLFVLSFLSVRDAFRYRRHRKPAVITLQLPDRVKGMIRAVAEASWSGPAVTLAGVGCGILVTLLDSLCTGQIYVPVVALISGQDGFLRQLALLAIYNLAFIAPLVTVFVLAARGADSERMSRWSKRNVFPSKLALAAMFAVLGVLLAGSLHIFRAQPEASSASAAPESAARSASERPRLLPEPPRPASAPFDSASVSADSLADRIASGAFHASLSPAMLARFNDEIAALLLTDPFPREAIAILAAGVADRGLDPHARNYCLQALPDACARTTATAEDRALALATVRAAFEETDTLLPGTALLALMRFAENDAGLECELRLGALMVAADGAARDENRLTALVLASERGWTEFRIAAERCRKSPGLLGRMASTVALRLADAERAASLPKEVTE